MENLFSNQGEPQAGQDDDPADFYSERKIQARLHLVQSHGDWIPSELSLRPSGDKFSLKCRRYDNIDNLTGPAKTFHDRAAELAGLSTEELLLAVLKLERRVIKWMDMSKKDRAEAADLNETSGGEI